MIGEDDDGCSSGSDGELSPQSPRSYKRLQTDVRAIGKVEMNLREFFDQLDINGNGLVNKRQFVKVLRNSPDLAEFCAVPQKIRQEDSSRNRFEEFFQAIDVNDDREFSWDDFLAFYQRGTEDRLHGIFQRCRERGSEDLSTKGVQCLPEEDLDFFEKHGVSNFESLLLRQNRASVSRGSNEQGVANSEVPSQANQTHDVNGAVSWPAFRDYFLRRGSVWQETSTSNCQRFGPNDLDGSGRKNARAVTKHEHPDDAALRAPVDSVWCDDVRWTPSARGPPSALRPG
jgi:Ca2+-binding EF-hand superfamily protein